MQDSEALKRKIASADALSSVVRTMKTMAAVNIRQFETAADSLRNYTSTIESGIEMLLSETTAPTGIESPISTARTGTIVFGSDQGMCGQFNEQVARFAVELRDHGSSAHAPVFCVGHRVRDKLESLSVPVTHASSLPGSAAGISDLAQDLVASIDEWRQQFGFHAIQVIHNRRTSAVGSKPVATQLLPVPLNLIRTQAAKRRTPSDRSLPLWTMQHDELLSGFVRQWIFARLFRVIAESLAAENAARITAMQSAERSISDRLQTLRSTFAQQRQTAITEELLDVVTGFEAMNSGANRPH